MEVPVERLGSYSFSIRRANRKWGSNMSKTVITIEQLECGQRGPYADSRYRARIKAERHGVYTNGRVIPLHLTEDEVKPLARRFVHNWVDNPEWHQPRLESMRPIDQRIVDDEERAGEWDVLIIQPFLD